MNKIRKLLPGFGLFSVLCFIAWQIVAVTTVSATTNPGDPGPCDFASRTVVIGTDDIETYIYHPSGDQCTDGVSAPYPAIVFAHGFSMFGLSNGAQENLGHAEHLASWGYVVAIPALPDDFEARVTATRDVLTYLEHETQTPTSFLHDRVDIDRLASAGYSLGGVTALAVASRDARVKAVVALDPVFHQGGPFPGDPPVLWDPQAEGPNIVVPTSIQGSPPSNCNSDADYVEIYPFIGATHRTSYLVVGANHCDFTDPGNSFCDWVCDGSSDPTRTQLAQKYMAAWFNYYLYLDTSHYTYLFGAQVDADVTAGRIERQEDTAPRGLTATGSPDSVTLDWELYEHPIIAGYNIYRRHPDAPYDDTPYAQVERLDTFTDTAVQSGQIYSYTLCSHDAAGNLHGRSPQVSAVAQIEPTPSPVTTQTAWLYLPIVSLEGEYTAGHLSSNEPRATKPTTGIIAVVVVGLLGSSSLAYLIGKWLASKKLHARTKRQ